MPAKELSNFQARAMWLRTLMDIMFRGAEGVKYRVKLAGWERDDCLGAEVHCRGWYKHFRVPVSMIDAEDFRGVIEFFAKQTDGAILMTEPSIQMIEREGLGLVH